MVQVLDIHRKPVNPCRPAEARVLLTQGKAAVFRLYPFSLILKEESKEEIKPLRLKIDPGSKTTGKAVVGYATGNVVHTLELQHRSDTIEKAHWIDVACVEASTPKKLLFKDINLLSVKATGQGSRQMCRADKDGFPRSSSKGTKKQLGFQTGDMVHALVTKGIKNGTYVGKVAIRSSGFFSIATPKGTVQGIKHSYCKLVHRSDGYSYSFIPIVKKEPINTNKPVGKSKDNHSSPGLSRGVSRL